MASLNLSMNGASIQSSYAGVVNSQLPSSNSAAAAQWALFSVQAPLMNAFQDSGSKESILKVESTGNGELSDLVEDFSEGRMQFAFVKVKDPNSGLPKNVLIAWCGGGVPERTKGYFTSHLNAVAKVLHGYHVQITARSDSDLEVDSIMRKVADASGSKYSSGGAGGPSAPPPPVKNKPAFTPTTSSAGRSVNPIVAARSQRSTNVDEDGWGEDAPPVTRTTVEKVQSSYKPTKVNMSELTAQKSEPSKYSATSRADDTADVVRGGYQPVGKVDIAAIRAAAKKTGDDRPTVVKGAYEPVGKVDIAAIRAKARNPDGEVSSPDPGPEEKPEAARPLADRAAVFSQTTQSERLTSLPKPKVANKFGGASNFSGTKAPVPSGLGLGQTSAPTAAPVGSASRTFADQGGKTPAQIWAEKKAKERGEVPGPAAGTTAIEPVSAQQSGSEWRSGYSGKSWAPVHTGGQFGRPDAGHVSAESTGEVTREHDADEGEAGEAGGVSALRDRFKNAAPMGSEGPAPTSAGSRSVADEESAPPPIPASSRPPTGGFALPGLPSRPMPADEREEEEEEQVDPSAYEPEEQESPPRIAVPVSRGADPVIVKPDDTPGPSPVAPAQIDVPKEEDLSDNDDGPDPARAAANAVAAQKFEPEQVASASSGQGGQRALIQYDYEKAEDNEIELIEGQYVTNIDMVDEDWWIGTNSKGESGLFPSNYVELVGGDDGASAPLAAADPEPAPVPPPAPISGAAAGSDGVTATALYDYEAAEDNELSFPEDAIITNVEFPDEDWWHGTYNGQQGLFPANYVQKN